MRIELVKATDHIEEAWHLLQAHRDELATNKHIMELKPLLDRYKVLDDLGKLLTLAMYDDDERLIGYSVTLIDNHMHYGDLVVATNDLLYLDPQYRKGRLGICLIRRTEQEAAIREAKFMFWHGKINTSFSALMPRIGYQVQDIVFGKEL